MASALFPLIFLLFQLLSSKASSPYLHCSFTSLLNSSIIINMYLPILALLYLLIHYTLANGCHTQPDVIGCPTMMTTYVMTSAITDFCALNCGQHLPPKTINVSTSWPGLEYSPTDYKDPWGNPVSLWANFRIDRTSNGEPYILNYSLCISLLEQASTGNGTTLYRGMKNCTNTTGNGLTYGGWGNTDFGTVFAEPICPAGVHCLPDGERPRGC